jgi:hypothetical protein
VRFPYHPAVGSAPETGEATLLLRPEIPIRVVGSAGSARFRALVDTGSDNTIFPKSVADNLGVTVAPGTGPELIAFGGQKLAVLFGDVVIEIEDEQEKLRWPARVQFFEFATTEDQTLVMGHAGFLDYFTATFDGKLCELTLIANDELPRAP